MSRKFIYILLSVIFIFIIIFYTLEDIEDFEKNSKLSIKDWYWNITYIKPISAQIVDNKNIYLDDIEDIKIENLYVTVLPTLDENNKNITLKDLNSYKDFTVTIPSLNIKYSNTNKSTSDLFNDMIPLGKITLRGHSTMTSERKSYKIKLFKDSQKWHGMDTIHLNKHPYDELSVRNKIAFDLLELVPNIISIRTKFVNLYVNDISKSQNSEYVDYGIFTNVEQISNRKFLEDHNLDPNGNFYKAEEFEFLPYEELKDVSDKYYNEEEFEKILEKKNGDSHSKIINMNLDVNNYNLDIDKVLDKHFNRDNYFTWLAVNILLGNYDTQSQNFFLYSPNDSSSWYFIPWDYDGSMGEDKSIQFDKDGIFKRTVGVSNYWNSTLHSRVFQVPENLNQLNNKIEEVYLILSKEKITQVVDKYMPIALGSILNEATDRDYKYEKMLISSKEIINSTTDNRKLYYDTLDKPMPIYLVGASKDEDTGLYLFEWTDSYDLQGDRIHYTLEISKTPDFNEIVYEGKNIKENSAIIDIDPGVYFWRVIVNDSEGNIQLAFDIYYDNDEFRYFGIAEISLE